MPDLAALRARIDRAAIVRNIRRSAAPGAVVDLRRDAFGHGLPGVLEAVLAGTDATVCADSADLARYGVVSERVRTNGAPTLDAAVALGAAAGTEPAFSLRGTILSVKRLLAGEGVSYGYTHRARTDTRVALVTGGYGQGIPRSVGNRVAALVAGERRPVIGRVAMDVCMIDVGEAAAARGDGVVLLGDPAAGEPAVSEWAGASGLQPLEVVTAIALRVPKEYVS